jgi:hypothetical protein
LFFCEVHKWTSIQKQRKQFSLNLFNYFTSKNPSEGVGRIANETKLQKRSGHQLSKLMLKMLGTYFIFKMERGGGGEGKSYI